MKTILLLFLLVAVAGCSVPSKAISVYFYKEGKLIAVQREFPTIENPVLIAIDQLMQGPNDQETASGIMTEVPNGTRARKVSVEGDTAIIDFNSKLKEYSGDNAKVRELIAQIVYTATNIRGVKTVILQLEGDDQFKLGAEGYTIDHPLGREDIKN